MNYQLISDTSQSTSVVERVLNNRGIKTTDINHYLNTSDADILNPATIMNIKRGAQMLISHIKNNDLIFIQVDSDCDGYTSSALLINYIHKLFPNYAKGNIKYRIHEGKQHGIIVDTIPEDVKLVIAPDASSNDYSQHEELAQRGIDVLVIDHHEADEISQFACIINNQLCDYPTKSLSGVGMVYKFCAYIDSLLGMNYADNFLDLAALGIIADMMDLRDFETKQIIVKGLSQVKNPYFKGMVSKNAYSLGGELTPIGIAFYIAPYVNATIRMGTKEEKTLLFESMLDFKGYELIPSTKRGCKGQEETIVDQACRNSTNIKNRQTKARDANFAAIENLIQEKSLLDNKILIIQLKDIVVDKNLTGLIANQLMAKYQRPVLILNKVIKPKDEVTGEEPIWWEGSGRGYDKSKFTNFRDFLKESQLVEYAAGHANALGVGIKDDNIDGFISYVNTTLKNFDFTPNYKVDFIYSSDNFYSADIIEIAELKSIWGQGVEEPFVALEKIKITNNNLVLMSPDKSPTLKITLPNGTSLIKFRSSQDEYEQLQAEDNKAIYLNLIGKCAKNVWNGNVTAQILIEDYEIASVAYDF